MWNSTDTDTLLFSEKMFALSYDERLLIVIENITLSLTFKTQIMTAFSMKYSNFIQSKSNSLYLNKSTVDVNEKIYEINENRHINHSWTK